MMRQGGDAGIYMQVLQWLVDATSVSGLVIYCAGMAVVMGVPAWAGSLSIIDGKSDGSPSQAIVAADKPLLPGVQAPGVLHTSPGPSRNHIRA